MGYLHIYTGNGKGKTTCSVGLAIRAAGAGNKVAFLQFDKGHAGKNEHYNERFILRSLPNVAVMTFGCERMLPDGKFRFTNTAEDEKQAKEGLTRAREMATCGEYFMVVCDEAITCVATKLYSREDLMELVNAFKAEPSCELILTGRGGWPELFDAADLVSEIRLIKHYFYNGVAARKGVEF